MNPVKQNRAPSLKALIAAFPSVDPERLRIIRKIWRNKEGDRPTLSVYAPRTITWVRECLNQPPTRDIRRKAIDELFDTHGVEYLGTHKRTGEGVYYCNSGDTYAATLIFHGRNMYIGCWGDLVERNKIREVESL